MQQFFNRKKIYLRFVILFIMLTPFEHIFAQTKKPSAEVQKLFLQAVGSNDLEKVKLFLENGASSNFYEPRTLYWETKIGEGGEDPLIRAILFKANDVAVFLIQYDRSTLLSRQIVDAYKRPVYKRHPLQIAIRLKNEKMIEILLQEIFNPTGGDKKLNETIKNDALASGAADQALSNEDLGMLAKLKEYGFTVSQKGLDDLLYSSTPDCSKYDFCKILLEMGANHSKCKNISGAGLERYRNPMTVAAWNGCNEIQKLLLEYGCSVNISCDRSPESPLFIAVRKENNLEFIKFLIEKGADVNFIGIPNYQYSDKKSILQVCRAEYKEFLILNGAR